jgi:type IV secretory pathway TrbL component
MTTVNIHIRRVYSYYVQNVVGIMGALTFLGFTVFAQVRTVVVQVLVLAVVTFIAEV